MPKAERTVPRRSLRWAGRRVVRPFAAGLLGALLIAGCSTVERRVVVEDAAAKREVALLTGTAPPAQPPAPGFAHLSRADADASLRRLVVRPSTWTAFVRDDPTQFLDEAQLDWARAALLEHLPALRADQRLELRFHDRFHGYPVVVEVWPEASHLTYRFTNLAERPPHPGDLANNSVTLRFVTLEPGPLQQVRANRREVVLTDPVFDRDEALEQKLNLLAEAESAAESESGLSAEELAPVRAALTARPSITVAQLRSYLERRSTLKRAQRQGLLSPQEASARADALLQELAVGGATR